MRVCVVCEEVFDVRSARKREVGGLAIHCPDCSEERAVRVVGVAAGDGKQASVSIIRPQTQRDRVAFLAYWHQAVGMHRGKECQMDVHLTTPQFSVSVVSAAAATNHKGRL